jgi:hypothetical protein
MPIKNPPMKGDQTIINALNELRAMVAEGRMGVSVGRPEGWPSHNSQDLASQYSWAEMAREKD